MNRNYRDGAIFMFISAAGYALFPVFTRQLTDAKLPGVDIATWRFIVALPLLWFLVFARRERQINTPRPMWHFALIGPLMMVAAMSAFYGLALIPASLYVLIYYCYPALIALFAALRGEKLEPIAWIALVLTMIGVVLSLPNFETGFAGANVQGVALALLNAVAVAVYFILNNRLLRGYRGGMFSVTAWNLTGTLIPLLLFMPFRQVVVPDTVMWQNLFGLAVFSTVIPIVALNAGINKLGPVRASMLSLMEPPMSLLLSVVLLGDPITPVQIFGGVLILASVMMLQWQQMRTIPTDPAKANLSSSIEA